MSSGPLAERALDLRGVDSLQRDNKLLRDYTDTRFYDELGLTKAEVDELLGRSDEPLFDQRQGGFVERYSDGEVIEKHKYLIGLYYSAQHKAINENYQHQLGMLNEKIDKLWVYYQSSGTIGFDEFNSVGDYVIKGKDAQFGMYASKGYEWMLLAGLVCQSNIDLIKESTQKQEQEKAIVNMYQQMPTAWLKDAENNPAYSTDYRQWIQELNNNWSGFVESFHSDIRVMIVPSAGADDGDISTGARGAIPMFINNIDYVQDALDSLDNQNVRIAMPIYGYTPQRLDRYVHESTGKALFDDSRREIREIYNIDNQDLPIWRETSDAPEWVRYGNQDFLRLLGASF